MTKVHEIVAADFWQREWYESAIPFILSFFWQGCASKAEVKSEAMDKTIWVEVSLFKIQDAKERWPRGGNSLSLVHRNGRAKDVKALYIKGFKFC